MKQIKYSKKFHKQFHKLTESRKEAFKVRVREFLENPNQPHLRYHNLKGKLHQYKSINITGDIRALLKEEGETLIIFYMIGSHSELY